MSALNTDTNRVYETPTDTNAIPVKAGAKIFEGALVGQTSTGYGRPLQAGDTAIGFAKDYVENTNGADGAKNCEIKAKGKVSLFISGITLADVGSNIYASDDNTFTLTATNNSLVGKLIRFERTDYGIVAFDFLAINTNTPSVSTQAPVEQQVEEGE